MQTFSIPHTMIKTLFCYLCLSFPLFFFNSLQAQKKTIQMSPAEVALNQYFKVTINIENERLKNYSPFPEIEGFAKRGTSSSTSTSFINGQMTSSQSITQNYQPTREGTFKIDNYQMEVNGETVKAPSFTVTVTAAAQNRPQQRRDPFDPFDRFRQDDGPTEFLDVEADAFLSLTTSGAEVYVGEGLTTTLAFYVSQENKADMRFFNLNEQLTSIIKEIKPDNCWEENFNIEEIKGQTVTINGKTYTQYKVYQSVFFPLNTEPITFPSVGLKLIKYKVAKNPSFFGRNRQEDYETFYSKPKTVKVRELPSHPLRDQVAVGQYRLAEKISANELHTGASFNYQFNVMGKGNISAIEKPVVTPTDRFDFYAPNVQQDINKADGVIKGTKSFSYYAIPNEPGEANLGDIFKWIYFDPVKERYDTLASSQVVLVKGTSRKNEYILSNDLGSFYDKIDFIDNTAYRTDERPWFKIMVNVFIFAILGFTAFIYFRN